MKTQILRLETHDDFISARDRMGWSQTERILLVWPEESHILFRRLDLILLQRHSESLGAQLALVSEDSDVRYHANQLGIPVFRTIQNAQKSHWRARRQNTQPRIPLYSAEHQRPDLVALAQDAHPKTPRILTQPLTRVMLFTLGVMALLSIAAILIPKATITLDPDTRNQELTLLVRAKPDTAAVNLSGDVPARLVTVEVEGRSNAPTSGTTTIPEDYAKGIVRFTNLTERSITIPVQTVVRTADDPDVRFATTHAAQVPAGVGEAITITVQAIQPGKSSNLISNQLIAIEGELGASLTSTNPRPTSGGTARTNSIATEYDREQLFNHLATELSRTAQDELIRQLQPGDILFTPTITISQVVEAIYEPSENLPSDDIGLNLRVEYQALAASRTDLEQLAQYALDANLPDFFQAIPETIVVHNTNVPKMKDDGAAEWNVRATRTLLAKIPESDAISLALGLAPALATNILSTELPVSTQPKIQITPSWWPRLPILPFRYTIAYQQ